VNTEILCREERIRTSSSLRSKSERVLESIPVHEGDEAEAYDAMIQSYSWLLNAPFVKMVSHEASGLKRGRVLDIGCGPGHIAISLALRNTSWNIVGCDLSENMIERATQHAKKAGVSDRVSFVKGEANCLPFPDGSFDLVVSHFVLHHIEKPESMFDESARVVRGGGKVMIKDLRRQSKYKAAILLAFSKYVLRYDERQMQMYRDSIHAALTPKEVRAALNRSRLSMAKLSGFRGLDFVIRT
jgi:ubiquinone biosynthesis O-methyltransferase